MDILLAIFIVLTIITVGLIYLLFKTDREESKFNTVFIISFVFVLISSWLAFSSLPENFTTQRIVSGIWPVGGIIALIMNYQGSKESTSPRILMAISMIGSLAQTLFI